MALVNTKTGEVDCVSGGAEAPFLLRAATGKLEEVATRGVVIGATRTSQYQSVRLQLHPGDTLIFTTDGITEARNKRNEFFADAELEKTLYAAFANDASLSEAAQTMANRAREFAGGKLRDDVCLMLVRRESPV